MRRLLALSLLLAACPAEPEPAPEPGAFEAGFASARIPAPLGIGTAGFGPFGAGASQSPYSELYPATRRIHGHPGIEVTVLSRGPGFELIFVRLDTVGVFQQLRVALVQRLNERLGRDVDDALVIGATHTHSGPGRVIDADGFFQIIADHFFPEFYDRLLDTIADTIEAAYADLQPARLGTGQAYNDVAHADRRCDDGEDHRNGAMPLVAIERNGQIDGLMMAYAIHGTALGIDDLTLSQDASGAIEERVADTFDHPVQVTMFNSWGADMAPGDPVVPSQPGAERPSQYDRMSRIGVSVADTVQAALPGLTWTDTPTLAMSAHRVFIDRERLEYDDETFPYEHGAVYCAVADEEDCDASTTIEGLDHRGCIPFTEDFPAPDRTELSAGRIGDLHFVTFPGEPGTKLAESVAAGIADAYGISEVMFFGYTQDYLGYSILEDDWWQGGYEASGALWGPRQGAYLRDAAVETMGAFLNGTELVQEAPPVQPFADPEYSPLAPPAGLEFAAVAEPVAAEVGPSDVITFGVYGGDPWHGAPVATLIREDGSVVLRANGQPMDSDGYAWWVDLSVDPPYTAEDNLSSFAPRRYLWRFSIAARSTVPAESALEAGRYRVVVDMPDASGGSRRVESDLFTLGLD